MAERNTDVAADNRIEFRIGINLGDVIVEGDDLFGDGVNIAARLEGLAEARRRVRVRHGARPGARQAADASRIWASSRSRTSRGRCGSIGSRLARRMREPRRRAAAQPALPLPDKPSIAVLPFANMSGDPEQEYFADGMAEDIITALRASAGCS